MKTRTLISSVGAGLCCFLLPGGVLRGKEDGEKEAKPASILFANAVADEGLAFLVLDGVDANPAGFAGGVATGWVQFPAGDRKIEVEHQPLGKVTVKEELKEGSRQAIIAYKTLEDQSEKGRPPRPTIGVLTLDCGQEGEALERGKRRVVVVNATMRDEVTVEIGGEVVALKRLKAKEVTAVMGGGFVLVRLRDEKKEEVSSGGVSGEADEEPLATLNVEEPVVSYAVLHDTKEGGVGVVLFAGLSGEKRVSTAE
jgi:hypothetical protein